MPFRYLRDPLFLICLVLYGLNRWLLKPLLPHGFFHTSLNDVLCIPFWVPIMLWAMRRVGLRTDDAPPRSYEILIPLLLWSYVFELILPFYGPFQRLAFCDPQDIVCYAGGALLAALFWRRWYGKKKKPTRHPK